MTMHDTRLHGRILKVRADAGDNPAKILAELKATVTAFKTENDERIKEINAGLADVVKTEKVDRINEEVTAIKAALEEVTKGVGRLSAGGGGRDPDEAKIKAQAEKFFAGAKAKPEGDIIEAYRGYRAAWNAYARRGGKEGELLPQGVQAALTVGRDTEGGFLAPTEMLDRIQKRMFETSDVRQVATVINTSRESVEFPVDVNEATSGGWVGEQATRSETATPNLGMQKIDTHEQYAEPRATQKLLDDAAFDVEGWLADKIADILRRTENTAFVTGDGIAKPRGFLDYRTAALTTADGSRAWGTLQYVASGAAGAFPTLSSGASDPDKLLDLIAALKPMYRRGARFAMSRATEAAIRKLKDADGRYFVDMGNIETAAQGFTLFGYPISTMEDMPALAGDSYSLAFGDFAAGYMITDRTVLRTLRDPYTTKGFVKFYTIKRVGGDVIDFDAIKLMKFATS